MGQMMSQLENQFSDCAKSQETTGLTHQILIDPRSPSSNIHRTPIQVKGCSLNALKERVQKANKLTDPLRSVNEAASKAIDCEQYRYLFACGSHLAKKYDKWIENLSFNSSSVLRNSDNDKHYRQLHNLSSRVVIVKTLNDQPVAYCRFRFLVDDEFAVLHLYEIYVEKTFRRKHIGSKLLNIVTMIAERTSMDKIVVKLTTEDSKLLSFFTRNNFFVERILEDEYSSKNIIYLANYCIS